MRIAYETTIAALLLGLASVEVNAQIPVTVSCPAAGPAITASVERGAGGATTVVMRKRLDVPAPIAMDSATLSADGRQGAVVVRNVSGRDITAVILAWRLVDTSGKAAHQDVTQESVTGGPLLPAGQTLTSTTDTAPSAGTSLASAEVACAGVLLSDGGWWGDFTKTSDRFELLMARRGGSELERKALLQEYKSHGLDALLRALQQSIEPH